MKIQAYLQAAKEIFLASCLSFKPWDCWLIQPAQKSILTFIQNFKEVHILWSSNFISVKSFQIHQSFSNEDFKYSDIYNNENRKSLNAKSYGKG